MAEKRNVQIRVTSNVGQSLDKMSNSASKAGAKQAGVLSRIKGLMSGIGSSASAATAGIRGMTTALVSSGVGAIVVAMGSLVALFRKSVLVSADFDKALSKLGAISGATSDEMAALTQNAKELGRTTAFTASEVVELQTEFSKLGFTASEITNVTEATLNLAAAADTDLATAAIVAGNTLRGFGIDASETSRVTDVMAKSFTTSALDMIKFQESMKLVAPIAATAKVSLEQSSAALAVLADRGVAGSLAGTQLRRIMSDLATKTGKDFATSLEITADRLDKATTTADKLAIAKELVGDRAKGSLIALAENRDVLNELTVAYENAGGAAQEMADKQLDNLRGDVTKLSSAWEGFLLNLTQGDGLITKISRGAVQLLTKSITGITNASNRLADGWAVNMASIKRVAKRSGEQLGLTFKVLGKSIEIFGLKAKKALAGVPIIGSGIDADRVKEDLATAEGELDAYNARIEEIFEDGRKESDMRDAHYAQLKADREIKLAKEVAEQKKKIEEEFVEGDPLEEKDDIDKAVTKRKQFLDKLKKAEEDFEDQTEQEKIERRRQRHLAELAELELTETEKRDLVERINSYYDGLQNERKAEDAIKDKELNEQKTQDAINAINELEEFKKGMLQNGLDNAARIAGEESAIGKGLLAIKQILFLKEMIMEAKKKAAKAKGLVADATMDGAAATVSLAKGKAKAVASLNPAVIAAYAASALSIGALVAGQVRKAKKKASEFGAGGGLGAPDINTSIGGNRQAPALNVIGGVDNSARFVADSITRNNQGTAIKTYVLESDVDQASTLARKTKSNASIG